MIRVIAQRSKTTEGVCTRCSWQSSSGIIYLSLGKPCYLCQPREYRDTFWSIQAACV